MKTLILALALTLLSLDGSCEEPKPIAIEFETEEDMLTAADDKMTDWESILEWFVSWNHSKLKENEEIYKSLNDWDTQLSKLDELKKQISMTNQLFLDFRNQCALTLSMSYEGKSEKREMHALAQFSLTTWYLDYLEAYLLPENWKELYQKSKKPQQPRVPH